MSNESLWSPKNWLTLWRKHSGCLRFFIIPTLVCSLLSGCGFHLRPQPVAETKTVKYKNVYVDSDHPYSLFTKHLRHALSNMHIGIAPTRQESDVVLHIIHFENNEHLSAVNTNTQTHRFLLTTRLTYELMSSHGTPVKPPQVLTANRPFTAVQKQILGANVERWTIEQALQDDIIHQLINQFYYGA